MNGLIGVDAKRAGPGRLRHRHGIQARSGDHVHDEVWILRMRNENLRHRLTSRPVAIVAHDANDFIGIGPALVVEDKVASNRIFSAPRGSREFLVDDHDARSVIVVTVA